jgi:predicted ester cyclase
VKCCRQQDRNKEETMSTESSRQFIERYIKAMTEGEKSPEAVAAYVSDESLQEHIAMFEAAFPNYGLEVHDILADGDKVALRATFRGMHRGDFQGISATGREVSTPLTIIYRIQDGKIAEHWLNADVLSLLQQLGAMPVPA